MNKISAYDVYRLPALDGGLVSSISARLLDTEKGFSSVFINYDTSLLGLPKKRPGSTPVAEAPAVPTGLHQFEKQSSGDRFLMVSHGSKVSYFDGTEWVELLDNLDDGSPVSFLTIADQVVMANGIDAIASWNGKDAPTSGLGSMKATARTFLLYANNDLRFTAQESGAAHITVQYEKAPDQTDATTVEVSGEGTEDSPYLILVNLAWNDEKILSKASDVMTAINNHVPANTIILAENTPESDGTREVLVMPGVMLTGGYDDIQGKYLVEYRSRAVVADKNKLHLSHTGDPHLWSPTAVGSNSVEVYVGPDDGQEISGILNMGDGGLLIGKPNTLYGLFGYKRDNFVLELLDPTVGVSSHRSMVYARPYAYWTWKSALYRSQPGGTPERMSFAIQEQLDGVVDLSRVSETVAFLYNRLYVVSFPAVGGGFVTYSYHIDKEKWTMWTAPTGMVDTTPYDSDTYYSKVGDEHIYKLDKGLLVDMPGDKIIGTEVRTVELDLGLMEHEKDIGDLYFVFRGTGETFYIDLDVFLDGSSDPALSLRKQKLKGALGKQIVLRVTLGKTARFMEVSIRDSWKQQLTPMALSYTYQIKDVV